MMRLAWSSPSALAMAPFQDLLNLGAEARMNVPGRSQGNWRWRSTEAMLSPSTFERLSELTEASTRSSDSRPAPAVTKSFAIESEVKL
jgi:4-alpha-glucanotransferase